MEYNGWKNYETWNIALWLRNDEALYRFAQAFRNWPTPYKSFIFALGGYYALGEARFYTPDGVAWDNSKVDIEALNTLIREMKPL